MANQKHAKANMTVTEGNELKTFSITKNGRIERFQAPMPEYGIKRVQSRKTDYNGAADV